MTKEKHQADENKEHGSHNAGHENSGYKAENRSYSESGQREDEERLSLKDVGY